jgi:hypothetical protein
MAREMPSTRPTESDPTDAPPSSEPPHSGYRRRRFIDRGMPWEMFSPEERAEVSKLFEGKLPTTATEQEIAGGRLRDDEPPDEETRRRLRDSAEHIMDLEMCLAYAEMRDKGAALLVLPLGAVTADAVDALKRSDLAIGALSFLLFWIAAAMLVWSQNAHAWKGIAAGSPHFGDFVYLSVGSAFGGPPGGIEPRISVARMLASAETIAGAIFVGSYLTKLWRD